MPKSIEAQGVTVDEAIQTALNLLGLGRDSVEIEIIHHPRSGFLGIGARRAKVRATMREQVMKDGEEFDMAPDGGSRGRRRRRSGRRRTPRSGGEQRQSREPRPGAADAASRRPAPEPRVVEAPPQGAVAPEREGGGAERAPGTEQRAQRGRGRGRRGGRGRGAGERRTQEGLGQRVPKESQERGTAAATADQGVGEGSATSRARSYEQPAAKRPEPEALRARAHELTSELLGHMGVDATVSAQVVEGGSIAVTIEAGEAGAVLIGRRGTTLDAVEHIVNRMTTGADPGARVRVTLDVCGYRERRTATLGDVAARLKQHALSTMRRVQITPLSPHDRIVFQEALAGDDSVTTRILGSGFYRRVLVVPRGLENDAGTTEEFNEDGQMVGYPASGGADEETADESAEEASPDLGAEASTAMDESGDEASEDGGKPQGRDS